MTDDELIDPLLYQVADQIVRGQFPLNKELAFELAALMAQIHFGDCVDAAAEPPGREGSAKKQSAPTQAEQALERFFPARYLTAQQQQQQQQSPEERQRQKQHEATCLAQKWASLRGKPAHDCVRIFLTCTRKWQFFGASLFEVQVNVTAAGIFHLCTLYIYHTDESDLLQSVREDDRCYDDDEESACADVGRDSLGLSIVGGGGKDEGGSQQQQHWLCVGEDGIAVLDLRSMQPSAKFDYADLVTFGGCQDDFMLVATAADGGGGGATVRMLFQMRKPEVGAVL